MKKLSLLLMGGCLFGLSVVGCKESAPSNNRYVNKWIGRQGQQGASGVSEAVVCHKIMK